MEENNTWIVCKHVMDVTAEKVQVRRDKVCMCLFLLALFHVLLLFLAQNLAADELQASSIQNIDASEFNKTGPNTSDTFTNDYGMRFVAISPGRYFMGSPAGELGRIYIFENQHEIHIEKQFYLQTTEVTQGQWEEVMGNNPSYFKNCGQGCPVENVSWFDVQKFILKLNQRSTESRYRLPTEAEWEYACRAGSKTAFSNGVLRETGCHEDSPLENIAWHNCNSNNTTHIVGLKMPNNNGLYDMYGNVNEWSKEAFRVNYSDNFNKNSKNIDFDSQKAVRGGSYGDDPSSCRSASRYYLKPSLKNRTTGFRLVRESKYYKINVSPPLETEKKLPEKGELKIASALPDNEPTPYIDFKEPSLFTVQVESTKSLDYAERQIARYTKDGHHAFHVKIKIPNKGIWYRICLGKFTSISKAELFNRKLARENKKGIIIKM
ncbi:MAG: SUMF1/EgtB/PvdO family nonheme iron enzyme [Thermodesulfobacteriota bacterium]